MAIKFEKKVIIGSLFSFLATAVGIIAVFFPDLLNLQKEKMETFTMDIKKNEDVKKLNDFLEKKSKDGKFFELDVLVFDYHNPEFENNLFIGDYMEDGEIPILFWFGSDKKYPITVSDSDSEIMMNWKEAVESSQNDNTMFIGYEGAISQFSSLDENSSWSGFYFPNENFIDYDNKLLRKNDIRETKESEYSMQSVRLKGIFFSPENNSYFKNISAEQLKLKNY